MKIGVATIAQLAEFDQIVDVRSPAEFAEDHIPGAINCPVLDDAQRAEVGTLYKQVSPFAARRLGGAYAAQAIGRHIEQQFQDKPKQWRPLIMCWRGGMRSGSMVTVLRAVGWDACQLDGGYKAFRHQVMADLAAWPARHAWRVVSGPTGSAKTRLLQALARHGGQVLDLETLANHRGSVLGDLPDSPQPGQKAFETQLWQALQGLDPARPVFVEAESRKIGNLHLPESLMVAIRHGALLPIEAPLAARVDFLQEDYRFWIERPELLSARLSALRALRGAETVARWQGWIAEGRFRDLVEALLSEHYDPSYRASQARHFGDALPAAMHTESLTAEAIDALAQRVLAQG
ncbi:MAG TPA: tRNA 2-selenouridine(34) synthase MnmH [Rhodocyclaceae bacterium]